MRRPMPIIRETIVTPAPVTPNAISHTELDAELSATKVCWKTLKPLDNNARQRVINWLHHWMKSEAGE